MDQSTINTDIAEEKIKFHQVAFLCVFTTFMSELLQTFIIPCAIYLPNTKGGFFAEFSYGVYFFGSITGLVCGLFIAKNFGLRSMYLLGIKLNLLFTSIIALLTMFYSAGIIGHSIFSWLYPYRIATGFSTNLTYGINSALVIRAFGQPVKVKLFGKEVEYASNKLFSWSYIVLLLEMTLNPYIDYHIFDNCSWHIAALFLDVMIIIWYLVARSALPKYTHTPEHKKQNLTDHLKYCLTDAKFLKFASCAGLLTGIIIIISVELPFFITKLFHESTNKYASINVLLIVCSALGAFTAGLRFVRHIKTTLAKRVLTFMILASVLYYFLPHKLSYYVVYLALIYISAGFCSPVLNDLIMRSVENKYQVTASILLNGFFLVCMVSFNFVDAIALHTLLDMQMVVFMCLATCLILLLTTKINSTNHQA